MGGKKSERHTVSAVAECEEMMRIPPMWTDVRQAIGCHREKAFPGVVEANAGDCRQQPLEMLSQFTSPPVEQETASQSGRHGSVVAAEQQTPISGPTGI